MGHSSCINSLENETVAFINGFILQTKSDPFFALLDPSIAKYLNLIDCKDAFFKKATTKFGRSTLKRWILCPLVDPKMISERLEIQEYLKIYQPKVKLLLKKCRCPMI